MSKKHRGRFKGDPITYQLLSPAGGMELESFVPWTLVKRGLKKQVITPLDAPKEFLSEATRERDARAAARDTALLRALGLAHHWQRLVEEGRYMSITYIATAEGMDLAQASRITRLTTLAPDIVEACATLNYKCLSSLDRLSRCAIPVRWDVQRARLPPV